MKCKKYFSGQNFDTIYRAILCELLNNPEYEIEGGRLGGGSNEITNLSFELHSPLANTVLSKVRNFREEFAKRFYAWMLSGSADISELTGYNPNAKNYMAQGEMPDNFSTAYGPRLVRQLDTVLNELRNREHSRRAIFHILEEGDNVLLNMQTQVEFPCADSIQIMIRDGKLNLYANFRSNNMVKTICYDVFNLTNLQYHILMQLEDVYPNLVLGTYYHRICSAHILANEIDLANAIINEDL